MPEINNPPCPLHGAPPRALHPHNFFGIVTVIEDLLNTISGVGTTSFSRCPYGYPSNFEGVVRALEDLNLTASGLGGGPDIAAGSGIYFTSSGEFTVINAQVVSSSGFTYSAGSGIYLSNGNTTINLDTAAEGTVSLNYVGKTAVYSGTDTDTSAVVVSGDPGTGYRDGALWFDTNEGRLFVYASGSSVLNPDWYQTNAEALAIMSEVPPSGAGLNAPARDGQIWFNTLMGNLFIYDGVSSGWYETAPTLTPAYGSSPPVGVVEGANFIDNSMDYFRYWNGSDWVILGSG
tara:strand:- start:1119 stop:1988 length:870 start_codon:yes stop_codon:yes gene_type:complete